MNKLTFFFATSCVFLALPASAQVVGSSENLSHLLHKNFGTQRYTNVILSMEAQLIVVAELNDFIRNLGNDSARNSLFHLEYVREIKLVVVNGVNADVLITVFGMVNGKECQVEAGFKFKDMQGRMGLSFSFIDEVLGENMFFYFTEENIDGYNELPQRRADGYLFVTCIMPSSGFIAGQLADIVSVLVKK